MIIRTQKFSLMWTTWKKSNFNSCPILLRCVMKGVYISFLNPSLLLQSFLFMKNKYLTFLNFVHFFLFWKLVHYLLKICTFLSLFLKGTLFNYSTLPSYNSRGTTLNLCRFLSYLNCFVYEQEKTFNARLWFRDIDFWPFQLLLVLVKYVRKILTA